jgi:hypothetical protein
MRTVKAVAAFSMLAALLAAAGARAAPLDVGSLAAHFRYLSTYGNSSCAITFMRSIAKMPAPARLQGSCCAQMALRRFEEQVRSLAKYAAVSEIPADPYDIEAALAKRMLAPYDLPLNPVQQSDAVGIALRGRPGSTPTDGYRAPTATPHSAPRTSEGWLMRPT